MQEPKSAMFADISHSHMEVLTGRNKTETVVSHDNVADGDDHGRAETIEPCIARFRYLFADDLEIRCGLVKETGILEEVEDVQALPTDIAVACLLNPLAGGMHSTVSHKNMEHRNKTNRTVVVCCTLYSR
jgi:hypothetical protein